jgi:hypothetical protein
MYVSAETFANACRVRELRIAQDRYAGGSLRSRRFVAEVSRHSTGVSVTQDLAKLEIDLATIMQAGGCRSTGMALHYAEKVNAARSGMARAAAVTERDRLE